jgi:hypothetical protein
MPRTLLTAETAVEIYKSADATSAKRVAAKVSSARVHVFLGSALLCSVI